MELIEIFGFVGALVIGFTLGLIGGGGSILTVPVLVYLLGVHPVLATAYSLFIVGFSALIGSVRFLQQGLVDLRTAVVFGIPAIPAVYATRKWIVPAIPDQITEISGFVLSKDVMIMLLFAGLMVAASYSMIRGRKGGKEEEKAPEFNYPLIFIEGIVVGILTGLVGAGGGFLIIPALVILAKLPMKEAVGTSLLIIAAKSLIGFLGDLGGTEIDWGFLGTFSALAVIGIIVGNVAAKYIEGEKLKKGFGYFVLIMGTFIILKETGLLPFD